MSLPSSGPALAGAPDPGGRPMCLRCWRPESACFCGLLPALEPRTKVVFLQHPRERKVAISTCRLAHLALAGSELHHGVIFDGHPGVQALAAEAARPGGGGVALLFPSPGALDPGALPPGWPGTLVVVDGTWSQARKLVAKNPLLAGLPRIGLVPSRPGNYRIRREPDERSLSTIEAVVEVLGLLEGDPGRFRAALAAFERMVDFQIERRATRVGPARYKRKRVPHKPARDMPPEERARLQAAVVCYVEANAGVDEAGRAIAPELLQLVAARPATGERFAALVRPRQALGAGVAAHLGIEAAALTAGLSMGEVAAAFARFVAGAPALATWGRFAEDLVTREGVGAGLPFVDLRVMASRRLKRRAGGIEQAAALLASDVAPAAAPGRAGPRLESLVALHHALLS